MIKSNARNLYILFFYPISLVFSYFFHTRKIYLTFLSDAGNIRRSKRTILFFALFIIAFSTNASYISSSKSGNWGTATTWSGSVIPGANDYVTINDDVTVEAGSTYTVTYVTINNNKKLIVNGTLIITGNFEMSSQGDFEMGPNSVVVVKGNVLLGTQTTFSLSSYFIVYGNMTRNSGSNNGSIIANSSHIYIFGTVNVSYSYFTVCNDYGGTTTITTSTTCDAGNFEALISNESTNTNTVISSSIDQNTIDVSNLSTSNSCICTGGSATLTIGDSSSPTQVNLIKWFRNQSLLATQATPINPPYSIRIDQAGTYYAIYRIGSLYYQTNSIVINSAQTPTATISGTASICAGSSTTLSVSLTGSSPWSFTYFDGTNSTNVPSYSGTSPYSITVSPSTTKTYTLTSVSNYCCTGTTSGNATITVGTLVHTNPIIMQ